MHKRRKKNKTLKDELAPAYKPKATSKQAAEEEDTEPPHKEPRRKRRKNSKLLLTTSNKDYEGNLGLPEKVGQRQYETVGQFMRRLDRLVAKAKVEANLESRFDINLMQKPAAKNKQKKSGATTESPVDLASSSRYGDKRRKRYGR